MMKLFASMGTIKEQDLDKYASNEFLKAMTNPTFGDSVRLM
jgi:hypothetical protein